MASATLTIHVRVRRLWPVVWWLRLAPTLARCGLSLDRIIAIGNALLRLAYVECRSEGGPFAPTTRQPFPGRLVCDDDELRLGAG